MNKNFILFANEYYGNTDWIKHLYSLNKYSDYKSIFYGKGLISGKVFYPDISYCNKNIFLLFYTFFKNELKRNNNQNIYVIRFFKYNLIILFFLKFTTFLGFKNTIYLDVRTLYAESNNKLIGYLYNYLILFSSYFYDNTFIINDLIAKKINLNKFIILPLGIDSNIKKRKNKHFSHSLNFIYVGKIRPEFNIFLSKFIDVVRLNNLNYKLDIFSYGINYDLNKLVDSYNDIIKFKGHLNRDNFNNILKNYDIGISHLPINNLFDLQPHTKLFEYVQNGLPFITKNSIGVIDQFNNQIPGWLYNSYDDLNYILNKLNSDYHIKRNILNNITIKTWDDIYHDSIKIIIQ